MCAFNYRFVPAIRLAHYVVDEEALGEIYHFRARYLEEWLVDARAIGTIDASRFATAPKRG